MSNLFRSSAVALIAAAVCSQPALAQQADADTMEQEIAAMREQSARMAERIDALERELAAAQVQTAAAAESAGEAIDLATEAAKNPPVDVTWKGAPVIEGEGGWSFKPRGRLQFDGGFTDTPALSDGFGSEVRRARLGVEGDIPGGFGYKFEVDFAGGDAEITDAILTYSHDALTLTVGQRKTFQSLEEMSSSRFTSFMERAAFTDAFGFERRVGISAEYGAGDVLLQAGVFTDNAADLSNKSWSLDGRAVYMPRIGETQLHFGGSAHYSELNNSTDSLRYRQRPFVHFTDERFLNTGNFTATSELGLGLETAVISGSFHAAAEGFWQNVDRPGSFADPTFFGGYAEVGYFLTQGDRRGYKDGAFNRVSPANPVGQGGVGAIQVNLRYDYLDLTDAGVIGGTQDGYLVSLIWTPTSYTRFMVNYARLQYENAAYVAGGIDTSYGVDAFGVRAQLDF